jgi:carbon monoxide dehydrogenase subunit G
MSVVTTSILVPAPAHEVWELIMDPARLKDWVTIHRRLDRADDGPPRAGYEMEQRICLRGVEFKVRWELVDCQSDRRAVWEGRGPARSRAHTEYLLHDEDGGTRFDYRNDFRAPLGPLGAAASRALVGGLPEREAKRSLDRLRSLFAQS